MFHCSKCCLYDDINATPLEFLPLAFHLYKSGLLEEVIEKINNKNDSRCIFSVFENDKWGCSVYPSRGLICRLFGFASVLDKHEKPCFAASHSLKENCPEKIQQICKKIASGEKSPVIPIFYRKLAMLDFQLGEDLLPINQAIKEACDIVYMHNAYL